MTDPRDQRNTQPGGARPAGQSETASVSPDGRRSRPTDAPAPKPKKDGPGK